RYYFRIQAYDQGGNVDPNPNYDAVTTVEWFPPISQIIPLPEYSKGSTVVLKLASHDVGGSPISGHEVQVYDHEIGEWTTLHDSVTEQIEFEGEIGHTYSFRSAATDRANNIEDWPTAPYGDTTTTLYERAITGHVYTNTGLPVTSAEVITNPPPINDPSSDQSGFYAGYLGGDSNPLTAFWTKDGYGSVPTTSYAGSQDVMVDAYLPPADNVVVNWDFEENPDTLANWMTGGLYVPSPNLDRYHTGIISATVGLTAGLGTPAPAACFNPLASATTPDGVFHVICEGMFHLSYDHGQWSAPTQISSDTPLRQNLSLLVGEDNSLHIFWKRTTPSATEQYIKRDPAGAWSAIMTLYTVYSDSIQAFAIDATGGVHVVYGRSSQNTINYAHCWPNGTWDSPTTYAIPIEYKISYLALTTDPLNQPIVFYWTNANSDLGFLSIIQKQSGGSWQNLLSNISTETPQSAVVVTTLADEEMAAVWISKNSTWITRRDLAGTWSTPIAAGPSTGLRRPRLQIAQGIDNKLYMFSQYIDWPARYFTSISFIDLDTNQRSESYLEVNRCEVTADQQGRLHVAYNFTNSNHLYYRYQDDAGNWYDELIKSAAGDIYPYVHDIAIDESGQPQFIYQEGANVIHQTRLIYAPQSGSSLLKQTVLVPAGDPYLSFMYATSGLGSPNVQLKVSVMQSGETTEVFATSPDIPFKWKHAVIDLSPWAGHSVTLGFSATQTLGQLRTAYFIDEVSIGTGYTDIWVHGAAGEARPGETLAVQIHYGNRSMVAAGASSLTLTLPAGLSLLEANPPADEPGGTTWTIGTIPAYANGLITLNLEVAPEVPLFTALVGDVSLTTGAELETANNHGQLLVRVGNYLFLPLVER
ncbi:MAG TPA: hypothetical protein PKG95_12085, partial [Anaerolineaceae bacterium]|nr:hypothetical protein [Anaerolineaceae bacterium]